MGDYEFKTNKICFECAEITLFTMTFKDRVSAEEWGDYEKQYNAILKTKKYV
jgi:hypothetical protein